MLFYILRNIYISLSHSISLSINKLPFHFTVLPLIVLSRYTRVSYDHSHCDFSGVSIWWIWWLHLHHTWRLQGRPKPFSWSLTDTEDDAIQPRKARECRDPRVNPNRRDKCFHRGKGIMLTRHISDIMKWASNKNFSKFPDVPFSVFLKIYIL